MPCVPCCSCAPPPLSSPSPHSVELAHSIAAPTEAHILSLHPLCFESSRGRCAQFCLALLVRMEKFSAADLRRCQAAFDCLDVDGSGRLDAFDIHANQLRHREVTRQRLRLEEDAAAAEREQSALQRFRRWLRAHQDADVARPPHAHARASAVSVAASATAPARDRQSDPTDRDPR